MLLVDWLGSAATPKNQWALAAKAFLESGGNLFAECAGMLLQYYLCSHQHTSAHHTSAPQSNLLHLSLSLSLSLSLCMCSSHLTTTTLCNAWFTHTDHNCLMFEQFVQPWVSMRTLAPGVTFLTTAGVSHHKLHYQIFANILLPPRSASQSICRQHRHIKWWSDQLF